MPPSDRVMRSGNGGKVVVVGAGGHAKVAIEALRYSGWDVIGCTDADPSPREIVGAPLLGGDEQLEQIQRSGVEWAFIAIGTNGVRDRLGQQVSDLGYGLATAIGPAAVISETAEVGAGAAIFSGAIIHADARIGELAIINTNASVDHDCTIGRAAHVAPGTAVAGCVTIGDRTFIGAGATIIPEIRIGRDVTVGAGSVVVRDLPDGAKAFGVPARVRDEAGPS